MSEPTNEKPEKERIRDALDVLQNYMTEDGRIDATKMTGEIRQIKEQSMTPSRAKEVLEGMGFDLSSVRLLLEYPAGHVRISARRGAPGFYVCGNFLNEQLQAIALWMQDPVSVVNA